MPSSGSDLELASAMHEGNSEIAQSRHDLGSLAGAETRTIFPKNHISHIMQRIFDTPVSPEQIE